ncbi:MAG: hypothetical protein HUJ63_03855, partial [Enterococcus sp.]|nr:hypothetical protein [Enterococcus sp.]
MKKILITGGPTNEFIDEVMKITNMSTGSLSTGLAECFEKAGYEVTLVLNNIVNYSNDKIKLIRMETTDELLAVLKNLSSEGNKYDAIIHAAAVGDY